jgi:hypothetical protein
LGLFNVLEFLEGAEVVALDGIDAALEAVELIVAAVEDPAQGVVVRGEPVLGIHDGVFPERRFGPVEAAE